MKKQIKKIHSVEETIKLSKKIGENLFPGAIITLEGDLGAGKTTFTKGIAKALNIKKVVNSPTFTIIKEYKGDLNLYHMDVYRLDSFEDLGFDEYFYGQGVCVIEWPSKIQEEIPKNKLHINIYVNGEHERLFELIPHGEQYEKIVQEVMDE